MEYIIDKRKTAIVTSYSSLILIMNLSLCLIKETRSRLVNLDLVQESEIIDSVVHRMSNAYPILDLQSESAVNELLDYSGQFQNLRTAGRNGRFLYTSMLDMLKFGSEVIDELLP